MPTSKDRLLEQLRRQKVAEATVESDEIIREWIGALDRLMEKIRGWVTVAQADDLLTVEIYRVRRDEERLGSYDAPALKLSTPKGDVIDVAPRARHVVGGYGRVDLECPPNRAILVRSDPDRWQFASLTGGQGWAMRDLDEESFWDTLTDLLP